MAGVAEIIEMVEIVEIASVHEVFMHTDENMAGCRKG
jgi:hypothetical protein